MLWLWANITAGHVAKARSDRPDRLAVSLRDVGMAGGCRRSGHAATGDGSLRDPRSRRRQALSRSLRSRAILIENPAISLQISQSARPLRTAPVLDSNRPCFRWFQNVL